MATEILSGRITFAAAAEAQIGPFTVVAVNWTGATAAHILLLDDTAGKEIVGCVAETNGTEKFFYFGPQGINVEGLTVTTMGGGRLTVYVK